LYSFTCSKQVDSYVTANKHHQHLQQQQQCKVVATPHHDQLVHRRTRQDKTVVEWTTTSRQQQVRVPLATARTQRCHATTATATESV